MVSESSCEDCLRYFDQLEQIDKGWGWTSRLQHADMSQISPLLRGFLGCSSCAAVSCRRPFSTTGGGSIIAETVSVTPFRPQTLVLVLASGTAAILQHRQRSDHERSRNPRKGHPFPSIKCCTATNVNRWRSYSANRSFFFLSS